ncbi:MAG: nucleotidyltransferase domain-containing protein [Deltaproteobacteria bacterium]|nr:nucleotidyltransferase domain-containing protein [Deltaproteobacteria bacterium]
MSEVGEALASLADRFGLAEIYAFGSRAGELAARARGQQGVPTRPDSDADLGVRRIVGRAFDPEERVCLTIALEDLFGATRVDLVVLSEAPPFLALEIVSGELLYCRDGVAQAEYELYVLRRAGDLAPFERERRRMILRGEAR